MSKNQPLESPRIEGCKEAQRRFAELLSEQIQAINAAPRSFDLRKFLLVLLSHHVIAEKVEAEQTFRKMDAHHAKILALKNILIELDEGKTATLPAILAGTFDLAFIRKEKAEFEAEVVTSNEILTKRGVAANVVTNWNELATELVNRAPNEEKFQALQRILTELAQGKNPVLPAILEEFDLAVIRKQWTAFEEHIVKPNEVLAKRKVEANCKECAIQLVRKLIPSERIYDWPGTPWDRIIGKVIGMSQVSDIDEGFIREWVAREAEYSESDPRAGELARLDADGAQYKLLSEMRTLFPQQAEEWFNGIPVGRASTNPPPGVQAPRVPAEPTPPAAGPSMEGLFFEGGIPYKFGALRWRLLKALYGKGAVAFEAIGDEVWGDSEWNDGRLRKLVSDTNDSLNAHKLRFEITSPMDAHYILQKLHPVTSKVT